MPRIVEDAKIPIVANNLKHALERRRMLITQTAEDMGHDKSYLTKCFDRGWIHKRDKIFMENVWYIKYDEYRPITLADILKVINHKGDESYGQQNQLSLVQKS